ncbi:MAG: hypothetical protein RJB62_562, partial [Pseudomonadota bacterium]
MNSVPQVPDTPDNKAEETRPADAV